MSKKVGNKMYINIEKVAKLVNDKKCDAIILFNESNMHYICSFSPSEGVIIVTKGASAYHIVDSRYTEIAQINAQKTGVKVIEIKTSFSDTAKEIIEKENINKLLYENETISLLQYKTYTQKFSGCEFVELNHELMLLRNKKEPFEIELMKEANNIAEKWIEYFNKKERKVVLADSLTGKGVNETTRQIQKIMEDEMQKMADKGRIGRKIRVMIVGIPNVGKSSFINRIAKKTSAEVGNKPGVTKQKQWIRINEKIELLDTPGVLWPKFENEKVAMNLAITGTIKDDILELTEVAYTLTKFMLENYRNNLLQRYSLDEKQINEILNQEQAENENIYEIMQLIGKKRGAILGGRVDDERTSKLILDDFRSSKLGKITLEIPE